MAEKAFHFKFIGKSKPFKRNETQIKVEREHWLPFGGAGLP